MAVTSLQFERVLSLGLARESRAALLALLRDAYGEDLTEFLRDIGPGVHLLGRVDGSLVTHAMIVDRRLQIGAAPPMRTAYVELVATTPRAQGRGYASLLMARLVDEMQEYDIAALSPVNAGFYAQFGWEGWRGPLFVRRPTGTLPTPGDEAMILRLPRTPADIDLDAPLSVEWRPGEVW